MALNAHAATLLNIKFINICTFSVAVFSYVKKFKTFVNCCCRNNIIVIFKLNCPYACCTSSHRTNIVFVKTYAHTVMCAYKYILCAVCNKYGYKFIVFTKIYRIKTAFTYIYKTCHIGFLYYALFCNHNKICVFIKRLYRYNSIYGFAVCNLKKVYDSCSSCLSACLRNLIAFSLINFAFICKEKKRIMA